MIASSWNYLIVGIIGFFTRISMNQKYSCEKPLLQSRIGAPHNIGVARGGLGVHVFPKFLEHSHFVA